MGASWTAFEEIRRKLEHLLSVRAASVLPQVRDQRVPWPSVFARYLHALRPPSVFSACCRDCRG